MGVGVPLLAMLDGEGGRVIKESGGGLVSPAGQGESLARNVSLLAAMAPTARAAMGQCARTYGIKEFDRDTLIDALEQHFHDAVAQNFL